MRPWDYHPDLTEERLAIVAQLIAAGRGVALDRHDPTVGDNGWTCGVRAYGYGCHQIKSAAALGIYPWLTIADSSLRFQFRVGQAPLRFYRGAAEDPAARMLVATPLEQYHLNFDTGISLDGVKFRIAVETEADGSIIQISFVAIRGSLPELIWPIPYEAAPPLVVSLNDERPQGVELDAPNVDLPDEGDDAASKPNETARPS